MLVVLTIGWRILAYTILFIKALRTKLTLKNICRKSHVKNNKLNFCRKDAFEKQLTNGDTP